MTLLSKSRKFYDNLILSGTKMQFKGWCDWSMFYDNLILSGTKIHYSKGHRYKWFYDNLILSGTKITAMVIW